MEERMFVGKTGRLPAGGLVRRGGQVAAAVLGGVVLAALVLAFVLPLVHAVLPLKDASGGLSLVFSSRVVRVAFRTLVLALLSSLLALVIGIPAAFFTATRRFPGRRLLLSLSAVPLCVPPLLVALGYVKSTAKYLSY